MRPLARVLLSLLMLLPMSLSAENAAVTARLKERFPSLFTSNYPSGSKLQGTYYTVGDQVDGKVKFGVYDAQGNELFPPKYEFVIYQNDVWLLSDVDKVYIYSPDRKLLNTVNGFNRVSSYDPTNRRIVVNNNKVDSSTGVIDFDGKTIIEPVYSYISNGAVLPEPYDKRPFITICTKVDGKDLKGLTDMNGKILIKPEYDIIRYVSWDKEFSLMQGDTEGRASLDGKILVPTGKYTKVGPSTKEGAYRTVKKGDLASIIDSTGREMLPFVYENVWGTDFAKGDEYITVQRNKLLGYIDRQGKEIVPPEYDRVVPLNRNGVTRSFVVFKDKNGGVLDIDGKVIIPVRYNIIEPVANGYLVGVNYSSPLPKASMIHNIPAGSQWGYYTEDGKEVVAPEYACILESEGLLLVNRGGETSALRSTLDTQNVKGGAWGYLDMEGNEIIPIEYDALSRFSGGVANGVKDGIATAIPHPSKGTKLKIMNGGDSEFNSPVDKDIPKAAKTDSELFAFIFAIENYNHYEGADYALRDGEIMAKYCEQALGAPAKNVRYFPDATYGNIKSNLKKIAEIAEVYDGDAKFIVYFAGLGTADASDGKSYMLPADAVPSAVAQTAIDINALAAELEQVPAKWTLLMADAPFNGSDRTGKALGEGRGARIVAKVPEPAGALFVVTAATGAGTAGVDKSTGHGRLTNAFLDNLRTVTAPTLVTERLDNISKAVGRAAVAAGEDVQTPTIKTGRHQSVSTAKF